MPLVAIPNVSVAVLMEVGILAGLVERRDVRVLDIHRDAEHGRSVLTCSGPTDALIDGMTDLATEAFRIIDLDAHRGEHPRVGALDVCPFVPHETGMGEAVAAARTTARKIGAAGIPVFLYGEASEHRRPLPEIRRGSLPGLIARLTEGLEPDEGPTVIDRRKGVVCVGARDVLIAFNVWIDRDVDVARQVAVRMRGARGVRALGLAVSAHGRSQISMNLVEPHKTGIDDAFEHVKTIAAEQDATPVATEIVGLVPERFLPNPDAEAARLLIGPGRSLESVLQS